MITMINEQISAGGVEVGNDPSKKKLSYLKQTFKKLLGRSVAQQSTEQQDETAQSREALLANDHVITKIQEAGPLPKEDYESDDKAKWSYSSTFTTALIISPTGDRYIMKIENDREYAAKFQEYMQKCGIRLDPYMGVDNIGQGATSQVPQWLVDKHQKLDPVRL